MAEENTGKDKIGGGTKMITGGGTTLGTTTGMESGTTTAGRIQHGTTTTAAGRIQPGTTLSGLSQDVMTILYGNMEVPLGTEAQAPVLEVELEVEPQLWQERDPMQGRHWSQTSTARSR